MSPAAREGSPFVLHGQDVIGRSQSSFSGIPPVNHDVSRDIFQLFIQFIVRVVERTDISMRVIILHPVCVIIIFHEVKLVPGAVPAASRKTHFVRLCPFTCCQSTPLTSQLNLSGVRNQTASFAVGQRKWPLCRLRTQGQTPCSFRRNTLMCERDLLVNMQFRLAGIRYLKYHTECCNRRRVIPAH